VRPRWTSDREFLEELELRRLEREERAKAQRRGINERIRLGAATADDLRQVMPGVKSDGYWSG
jgi:hypothetical protein